MKKTTLCAIIALVLLLSIAVPSVLAQEGPVSGSFTTDNTIPSVTAVEVYTTDVLDVVAPSMTPQGTYYVKVTATDDNTVDDIDWVEAHLFFDLGNGEIATPDAGDAQNCAILRWDKLGSVWSVDQGAGTTWAVVPGSSSIPADMTASSGDWVFAVTIGKVATESVAGDDWDVYARIYDGSVSAELYTRGKQMLWYGEIWTDATFTADFGIVTPGTGFADGTNDVTGIEVIYTSNGEYDQQAKSDATWTGVTYNATFDDTGVCDDGQEFSLQAYDADTFDSALQLDTTGVSIDATGTQTDEAGNTVDTNTVWLKVASVFAGDTYTGNITFIIADR
jgi:hypothetical protein